MRLQLLASRYSEVEAPRRWTNALLSRAPWALDEPAPRGCAELAQRLAPLSCNLCKPAYVAVNDHTSSNVGSGAPGDGGCPLHHGHTCTPDALALQGMATYITRPVQQLLQRWHALQADVRRARHAAEPQRIQHYVLGGAKLARLGVFDEVGVLRHMTRTLLHTARDPGLPSSWCRACLEQLAAALNELRGLLGPRGARAAAAIEAAVRHGNLGPAVLG